MKYRNALITPIAATLLLSAGAHAQVAAPNSPAPSAANGSSDPLSVAAGEIKNVDLPTFLQSYIAQWASGRSNILNAKYIKPDDSQQKGGWAVDYKWSKAKDKSHVGSDQHNDYVVDKLSYAVD